MIFNKKGKIVEGKYKDWEIVALEDDETGGYYLIIWSEKDNIGYDNWFERFDEMEKFFKENYVVEWTEHDYTPKSINDNEKQKLEEFHLKAKRKGF